MKTKSVFISTIAIVVLLAVAIATGTYAWYVAQSQVDATDAKITTAKVSSAAINLTWNVGADAGMGDLVTTTFDTAQLTPMIPTTALANYTTGDDPEGTAPLFKGSTMYSQGGSNFFSTDGTDKTPWKQVCADEGENNEKTTLYVMNMDMQSNVYVTPTVTFTAPAAYVGGKAVNNDDLLRVAIYSSVPGSNEFLYMGTWGPSSLGNEASNPVSYGAIEKDANINTITTNYSPLGSNTNGEQFKITPGDKVQVFIYAWLEGTKLTNERAPLSSTDDGSPVTFSVVFNASQDPA